MSSFGVFFENVKIEEHPNADRLELATVGLYKAVVGKGQFVDGERALYIPEQAIVPDWLMEELNLVGKLAGGDKNRIKAVRLRGVLSQGIVAKTDILTRAPEPVADVDALDGEDVSKILGVEKWKPEIPIHMSGEMMREPNVLLPWTDMENIHRYPEVFEDGEEVILTEKIHGTCLISTMFFDEEVERIAVVSKGLATKGISFRETENNLYWRAVNNNPVRELARELKSVFENSSENDVVAVGIYGEVFGVGIQDLGYGTSQNQPQFRVFDAQIRFAGGETVWVDTDVLRNVDTPVQHVPLIWRGVYSIDAVAEHAAGKEQVSGKEANLREGVVIRPVDASKTWGEGRGAQRRKIAKFVTEEYLTRKNGTEYN